MSGIVLLLLLLMIENKETKKYKLGDLFEMQTGVVEDKYLMKISETEEKVEIVKINSFTEEGELFFAEKPVLSADKEKPKDAVHLKTIGENKIIQVNDFLIYTRGKPKGFSALKFTRDNKNKYAASHHFIYLRPRTNIIDINIPYLHLMMDLYTQKYLTENYGRKLRKKKTSTAMGNSISIKELKDFEITLLKDIVEQEKIVGEYEKKRQQYQDSRKDLQQIGDLIRDNIFSDEN